MRRYAFFPVLVAVVVAFSTSAGANTHKKKVGKSKKAASTSPAPLAPPVDPGLAESRLIEVYQLVARSESRQALERAQNLVRDYPHFQLAQLVYGDLLSARIRHVQTVGDVPESISMGGATALSELRDESQLRL
ncbi:MAG: hypothetical protein D4R79_03265, partial [Comamonadaceae bacterium]